MGLLLLEPVTELERGLLRDSIGAPFLDPLMVPCPVHVIWSLGFGTLMLAHQAPKLNPSLENQG